MGPGPPIEVTNDHMAVPDIPARMKWTYLGSILLMLLHKMESYLSQEWEYAPTFQFILSLGLDPGPLVFLTFVCLMFTGLFLSFLLVAFRWGQWFLITAWGLTFILELLHLIRTIHSGSYYSGSLTASLYIAFGVFYWREWWRSIKRPQEAQPCSAAIPACAQVQ